MVTGCAYACTASACAPALLHCAMWSQCTSSSASSVS